MKILPFFENMKIHEGKNLGDKETVKDLKSDLDQLATEIQKLPALTKMPLDLFGVSAAIFNAKAATHSIFEEKDLENNVSELRKNINNLMNTLDKNKQFDGSIKSFLGEDYFSKFSIVCDIVNRS